MKTVKLIRNHTEAGVKYYAGQTVTLPDETADWIVPAQADIRQSEIAWLEEDTPGMHDE